MQCLSAFMHGFRKHCSRESNDVFPTLLGIAANDLVYSMVSFEADFEVIIDKTHSTNTFSRLGKIPINLGIIAHLRSIYM